VARPAVQAEPSNPPVLMIAIQPHRLQVPAPVPYPKLRLPAA
jgi:hypothetical protein